MIDLSIIIVNYNTKDLLKQCLESLLNCSIAPLLRENLEIIVVDNGSTDGSVELIKSFALLGKDHLRGVRSTPSPSGHLRGGFRGQGKVQNFSLRLIENKQNLGFAKANNIGIRESTGKYVLLLNSDTVVFPDTLVSMIQYIDTKPEVGVETCRVELPDGSLDPACHRGFPTPWAAMTYFLGLEKLFPKSKLFGQYHLGFLSMDKPHEIDSPTGAFYLIRREVIDKVGFLDEDYFMYGEDLDWSYRIKQAGWKIMYYPSVKIIHFKKQSGRANEDEKLRKETQRYFYETMETFYRKHYQNKYPRWLTNLIIFAIEIKRILQKL